MIRDELNEDDNDEGMLVEDDADEDETKDDMLQDDDDEGMILTRDTVP
jgi:hypothetical protein